MDNFSRNIRVNTISGDVKMKTKADYSRERRRGSLHDAEHRMLEGKLNAQGTFTSKFHID